MMPLKRFVILFVSLVLVAAPGVARPAVGATATTRLISAKVGGGPGNDDSEFAEVSSDGTWVAFQSDASDLVANDGNGVSDIFLRRTSTGVTR